jgi:hypothetical protein
VERGWGVNILEDARHSSVLYICKYFVASPFRKIQVVCQLTGLAGRECNCVFVREITAVKGTSTHCKQFSIYVFPKKLWQSLISQYQQNICDQNLFSYLRTFIRIHWYTVPPTFQFTVWEDGFDYIVFFQMGILDMIQHFMQEIILFGIMLFCRELQNYRCSYSAVAIGKKYFQKKF